MKDGVDEELLHFLAGAAAAEEEDEEEEDVGISKMEALRLIVLLFREVLGPAGGLQSWSMCFCSSESGRRSSHTGLYQQYCLHQLVRWLAVTASETLCITIRLAQTNQTDFSSF